MVQLKKVESSNIEAIGYNAGAKVLFVKFKSGAVYGYDKVPPIMNENIKVAESKGKFINENVKPYFTARRIDLDTAVETFEIID